MMPLGRSRLSMCTTQRAHISLLKGAIAADATSIVSLARPTLPSTGACPTNLCAAERWHISVALIRQ